jgi:TIR domain
MWHNAFNLAPMSDRKITLFLSHAWEDKESFVEPLYQALKDEFDVWYDKARITLGDSIYEKISEGIRECDFGVVVFSPHFLKNNWTQEEFNGLKALQTEKRKVILPILHNLTIDELRAKWPIEAGKLSISSTEGIPAIVQAIHYAVGADRQNKEFDEDALKKAFGDFRLVKELKEQLAKTNEINEHLLKTSTGPAKIKKAGLALLGRVKDRVDELSHGSKWITATTSESRTKEWTKEVWIFTVTLQSGLYWKEIGFIDYPNHTDWNFLRVDLTERFVGRFSLNKEVVWVNAELARTKPSAWVSEYQKEGKSNEEMVEKFIKDFLELVTKQESEQG